MTTQEQDSISGKKNAVSSGNRVLVLSGPVGVFRLNKERVVIGSVVSADVCLGGHTVAPIHAVIEFSALPESEATATIYDLASETGVFVNGRQVVTETIRTGDKIAIGAYLLTASLEDLSKAMPKGKLLFTSGEGGGKPLLLHANEDLESLLLEDEREVFPIFDYRPAQKKALEVVMSWRGTILDVEHFVTESQVTIGQSRKSDFGIPPLLSTAKSGQFQLIQRKGESYTLNVDPRMKGVIQRKGKVQTLDHLRRGPIPGGAGGQQLPLDSEDFAKISIGEIDFYLSFTAAPPRLKGARFRERDPLFLKIFWVSIFVTVGLLQLIMTARVPQNIEAEQIPERIATILYNPDRYIPKSAVIPQPRVTAASTSEPTKTPVAQPTVKVTINPTPHDTPKPVPTEMVHAVHAPKPTPVSHQGKSQQGQKQGKEGAGARAKGTEGTRGQPHAKPGLEHQDKATRPGPSGGKGAGGGNSQVPGIGNVDLLNTASAKITDILGNSAERLGKGGEKLRGFGAFTTQGSGGLALGGNGKGGGGTADTTLGGLTDHGHGGGKVGTGSGAAGNGTGIVGGKVRVAIRTGGPEEAVVMGSIDADAIEAAMLAHRDEFRLCYEKEINAENPNMAGRVSTSFVIGSTGRVTHAGVESSTLKNANTERCILDVIRRIDFPIPRGAGVVQVSYPFKFNRSGGR